MRLLLRKPGLTSLALMLPALFLSTAGILSAFGVEAANHVLEAMLTQTLFKLLLSPGVALGGPLVAFALTWLLREIPLRATARVPNAGRGLNANA